MLWKGIFFPGGSTVVAMLLCAAATFAQQRNDRDVRPAVVRIISTCRYPDLGQPWHKSPPQQMTGTGTLIDGQRIITNAHLVLYAQRVLVQPFDNGETYLATVVGVAKGLDLALLRVDDPSFSANRPALKVSNAIPRVRQTVHVYGFPVGGAGLSVTKGVVSRIEYDVAQGLVLQIDAALNPGNSGGPAIVNNEMIGLAYGVSLEGQSIGYLISGREITLFLNDMKDGTYEGRPHLDNQWQPLRNAALREHYGVPQSARGILVVQPADGNRPNPLQEGDVLLKVGNHDVDDMGKVGIRNDLRLDFNSVVPSSVQNDRVPVTVLRKGVRRELTVPVTACRKGLLEDLHGEHPRYFVYGPLVFATATINHVNRIGAYLAVLTLQESPLVTRLDDTVAFDDEELVLVTGMLPHRTAIGYEDPSGQVVSHVNEIPIRNLRHLLQVLQGAKESHLEFRFADHYAETLVFRRQEMSTALNDVLSDNGIRNACSPDLLADWSQLLSGPKSDVLSRR